MNIKKDKFLDVAYVQLKKGSVSRTIEIKPGILVDIDKNGEVIGIEVLSLKKLSPQLFVETNPKDRRHRV